MLGERIRNLRLNSGMTAQQLAQSAELSPAQVSQIERGNSDPSLDALRRIAKALNTPLFDLFAEREDRPVRVVREHSRMIVQSPRGGISYSRVSPGSGMLEVLAGELAPGAASHDEPWSHPPSEECVLVTSGTLTVEVNGEDFTLGPGDSAYFASIHPHRYVNYTDEIVRFTISISPPGY
ncbi:helix-turn-helix domain-containing protein [Leucobacter viscericola]|uniref:Helix-turn-helix domain-containing protein n=1 Tax=Leucobacter viscericola TaxID=2714935 RepID=A0A6G7XIK7_9MICO|nr:XRE family transcriptional regulator [Leucobacter viscericola]QIK64269.1 helix-turn-helix domain-containing protein [Leucobacter viscericola]